MIMMGKDSNKMFSKSKIQNTHNRHLYKNTQNRNLLIQMAMHQIYPLMALQKGEIGVCLFKIQLGTG